MDKKGVAELKRRFTKENCTFTRLCGCYVDAGKNKVVDLSETFLNLEDEEFYKYLEIAKKTLSGTIGNNLLELNFPLDESEEVFEYLLCAICPVQLSKPGLGYREDENRIGPRIRDWVVSVPDSGFLFPAFTDRSTDIHSLMFYTKDTKAPHAEFMELGLGCGARRTATEQKMTFHSIVKQAYGDDVEKSGEVLMEIQQNLNDLVEEKAELEEDPVILTPELLTNVMEESGVAPEKAEKIGKTCAEEFAEEAPLAENVVDSKALAANEQIQKEKELVAQVEVLQQQLKEKQIEEEADEVVKTYDVVLRVKPEKVSQIKSEVINGQKCLVIPMAEDEHANVNGVNTQV